MRKTIFVVDPDQITFDQLSTRLQEAFALITAPDAEQAFDAIDNTRPHLIISEMDLPGMDGCEFCARIRGHESTSTIPFIIVSKICDKDAKVRALKAGVDDYFVKPCDTEEIILKIQRLIERAASSQNFSTRDPLTTFGNERYFAERLTEECEKCRRYNRPLSLLLVSIDNFAQMSEPHSQTSGDGIVKSVAALLAAELRTVDVVSRTGTDEFAVLLPETTLYGARRAARRLQAASARLQVAALSGTDDPGQSAATEGRRISFSIGIGTLEGQDERNARRLHESARSALARAKEQGNTIIAVKS